MKLIIKQLQGSEITVDVTSSTSILEIKQQIEKKLKVPIASQRLLFLGRALVDEYVVSSYPTIKDGTKLNLAVKKPDGLHEVAMKEYKKQGLSDAEAAKAANRLLGVMKQKLTQLSWDDLNRLTADFIMTKSGARPLRIEPDNLDEFNLL